MSARWNPIWHSPSASTCSACCGPELRLLAMSATADGARLAGLMGATVIESAGRMFPVTIQHATPRHPQPARPARRAGPRGARRAGRACGRHSGLPARHGEIRRAQAALDGCGALVLPLHGDLPPAEQDRALRPAEGRRVVLATSIAETSLTVPGVRIVVDGGWRRDATARSRRPGSPAWPRCASPAPPPSSAPGGRAARRRASRSGCGARRCIAACRRTTGRKSWRPNCPPWLLDCAAWGTPPADLPFQDQPPAGALAAAAALLSELGALDAAGRITAAGRRMAQLGAHPRLAAMMLAARTRRRGGARRRYRRVAGGARSAALAPRRPPISARAWPPSRTATRPPIAARCRASAAPPASIAAGCGCRAIRAAAGDPGRLLAAAFPDRIAQRRGEPGSFRLSGGGGGRMPRTDPLANAPLLVAAALEMKAAARIRLAAPLDPDDLPPALPARVTEQVESGFDPVVRRRAVAPPPAAWARWSSGPHRTRRPGRDRDGSRRRRRRRRTCGR